ncbi:MAG: HAD-IA family hydrolase [Myxococcota bacterium]|nr:HAD-IA family hydrolase [Myxococcota bacterium]
MPAPVTFLVLDLDGTVLDTVPGIVRSLAYACEKLLDTRLDDTHLTAGIGTPLYAQMADHYRFVKGVEGSHEEIRRLCDTYIEHNRAHHDETVRPFPGMATALEALTSAGLGLGIVTSKPQAIARRGLRLTKLETYFQFVIGFDDVVHPKPHPEPILKALNLAGKSKTEVVFIGDSPHDLVAGQAAGIRTAAALWGPFSKHRLEKHAPDFWLVESASLVEAFVTANDLTANDP